MIDTLFLLAVAALGWGLSLATYRLFALRQSWPMGALQIDFPVLPALLGGASAFVAVLFAASRADGTGGGIILLFGILLAIFWTGFLRVGSQVSLFLAPIATVLLVIGWIAQRGA